MPSSNSRPPPPATADIVPSSCSTRAPGAVGSPPCAPVPQETWVLHPDSSARRCLQLLLLQMGFI